MIAEYGCHGNCEYKNIVMSSVFDKLIKPDIDRAQAKYREKVEAGQNFGRKKQVYDDDVAQLAKEGRSAQEIAEILGVKPSIIYHNEAWKNRKNL